MGIRVQASEILPILGEATRGMLNEFENAVLREPSRVPVPGWVDMCTYFGGLCKILRGNPKAFVDDVVKAFEKAGDEKKSVCLEFLLGNHPIELLHPYTMMLQRLNFCSIFSPLLHFLYCIFCGKVSGGGAGRL
ncbi:hypothetical protein Tco_1270978 [Tanacetum coccineum]